MDPKLKVAYDKSNEVVERLKTNNSGMVSTAHLIEIVQDYLDCSISVSVCDFSKIDSDIKTCGAMMLTQKDDNGKRKALIVLNQNMDSRFQRFSLVHELGHLMVDGESIFQENSNYRVSTHVDYNVTSISQEKYNGNDFLLREQNANIFALRTLMPHNAFFDALKRFDSLSKVADYFGLSSEAVISRIMLVE